MTEFTNEADSNPAVQPRSVFCIPTKPPLRGDSWLITIPILALSMAIGVLLIAPEPSRDPPPALQALSRKAAASRPAAKTVRRPEPEPIVRVNVTPGGEDSFSLAVQGVYRLQQFDQQQEPLPTKPDSGKLIVTSTKKGLKIGSREYSTSGLEIIPDRSPAIRVNGHLYRGRMRLFRRTDGKVSAVNVLPIEEYLASVVDSEMPARFPVEARKAQAIVARTYALYQISQADPKAVFDLLSSQRSQKYLGVEYLDESGRRLAGESAASRQLVTATRGIVCQHRGSLFCTYYSAVCGGQTTDGRAVFKDAIEVVKSVPCNWCRESPHYRWTTEISRDEFARRTLGSATPNAQRSHIRAISQRIGPDGGAISRFDIESGERPVSLTGIELRERLPTGLLLSPHFVLRVEQHRVIFEGRGHGHGVGFCQWGAKGQADAGRPFDEIIRHYYPGAELATLPY